MAGLLDFPNGAAFGTGSPAETAQQPSGLGGLLGGLYNSLGLLAKRAIGNSQTALDTGNYNPAPAMEAALTAMSGAMPLAANLSKAGEVSLGIVPVDVGKAFMKPNLPETDLFRSAVANTKGARVEDGSLVMPVTRNQRPEQAMDESVRGGVFYLPQGSKDARYYTGTKDNFAYGGTDKIAGETAINNPLFVKGATGGKAPEAAYDQLLGKGAYQAMRDDALHYTPYYFKPDEKANAVRQFLQKYAPEMEGLSDHILANSKKGNQLAYALQEAAVASAARRAGHDSVIGYSVGRKTKEPTISELYDVRESHYPNTLGDYQTWPQSMFGK